MKVLIWGIVIFLLILCGFTLYKYIFYPAYLSVEFVCGERSLEKLQEEGYTLGGVFNVESGNITLYGEIDPMTLKHENVHRIQSQENRLDNCSHQVKFFFDEVEAYVGQYLPDSIYGAVYEGVF